MFTFHSTKDDNHYFTHSDSDYLLVVDWSKDYLDKCTGTRLRVYCPHNDSYIYRVELDNQLVWYVKTMLHAHKLDLLTCKYEVGRELGKVVTEIEAFIKDKNLRVV